MKSFLSWKNVIFSVICSSRHVNCSFANSTEIHLQKLANCRPESDIYHKIPLLSKESPQKIFRVRKMHSRQPCPNLLSEFHNLLQNVRIFCNDFFPRIEKKNSTESFSGHVKSLSQENCRIFAKNWTSSLTAEQNYNLKILSVKNFFGSKSSPQHVQCIFAKRFDKILPRVQKQFAHSSDIFMT